MKKRLTGLGTSIFIKVLIVLLLYAAVSFSVSGIIHMFSFKTSPLTVPPEDIEKISQQIKESNLGKLFITAFPDADLSLASPPLLKETLSHEFHYVKRNIAVADRNDLLVTLWLFFPVNAADHHLELTRDPYITTTIKKKGASGFDTLQGIKLSPKETRAFLEGGVTEEELQQLLERTLTKVPPNT